MSYELILLAAGQGKRMQAPRNKVLLYLLDKPVIAYSLELFLQDPNCAHIILVARTGETELLKTEIQPYLIHLQIPFTIVEGGAERQDSVYQGLLHMKDPAHYVFVHDGARPFLKKEQLTDLYQCVLEKKAAILGIPVKDTIKKVQKNQIERTIPREQLWQAQTPQAFIGYELKQAHEQGQTASFLGTDDASLMEMYSSRQIELVLGRFDNIKLTTPEDLLFGEVLAKRKGI